MGKDGPSFQSSSHAQYNKHTSAGWEAQGNCEMSNALKKDLRSSHFNMGNSEQEKHSSMQDAYKKQPIENSAKLEQAKLAEKMRGANFTYSHGPQGETQTSYNQFNNMPSRNEYAAELMKSGTSWVAAQETNLKLGTGKYQNPSSEAKSMFQAFSNQEQSKNKAETNAQV